jgi:hypothetical protein
MTLAVTSFQLTPARAKGSVAANTASRGPAVRQAGALGEEILPILF